MNRDLRTLAIEFPYSSVLASLNIGRPEVAPAAFLESIKGDLAIVESEDGALLTPGFNKSNRATTSLFAFLSEPSDKVPRENLINAPWFRAILSGDRWSLVPTTREEVLG